MVAADRLQSAARPPEAGAIETLAAGARPLEDSGRHSGDDVLPRDDGGRTRGSDDRPRGGDDRPRGVDGRPRGGDGRHCRCDGRLRGVHGARPVMAGANPLEADCRAGVAAGLPVVVRYGALSELQRPGA